VRGAALPRLGCRRLVRTPAVLIWRCVGLSVPTGRPWPMPVRLSRWLQVPTWLGEAPSSARMCGARLTVIADVKRHPTDQSDTLHLWV
jgi:hypothetical protein